ncbi:MAG TPA: nucleotidyltransferase domain-containing protein [Acidimicrobiales bacterium]|nr:nucleotidyltransferase domain-containing protein [Acidimicrobiales bacterium]
MEHLAQRLAAIPGVVAVALGGSRATGTARPDSDWDFGLYYRGSLDPDDVRALGWPGQVFGPGQWGRIVDGGAWLRVDGVRVDLIYRDLDVVLAATAEAEAGRFEIHREVGYVAGIATYVLTGELALGKVLSGQLPRPAFPEALRQAAPAVWSHLAAGAAVCAEGHLRRGDQVAGLANLTQAVLAGAQARLASEGQWALNEKGIVERAGLGFLQEAIRADPMAAVEAVRRALALPDWGPAAG